MRVVQPAIQATAPIANEIRADPKRYGFSFDLAEAEKGFEEPTLIIAARQDMVVGYRDAWTILDSYPRATFAVLDRADHGWPLETPNLLAGPDRRLAGAHRARRTECLRWNCDKPRQRTPARSAS